jgi:DNA-binding NarL/FixJ family response regulator
VADDHPSVRSYVCGVLNAEQGWNICGEAANGREAVEKAVELKPDLVVLDLSMPELNGLEAARQILTKMPQTDILILTLHECEDLTRAILEMGVGACVMKTDLDDLVAQVRTLSQSNRQRNFGVNSGVETRDLKAGGVVEHINAGLTDREREILRLLAESKTNKEIAVILSIEPKAVEMHRSEIMHKLEIHSVVDLVRCALGKRAAN